jgi:hypothetical protein
MEEFPTKLVDGLEAKKKINREKILQISRISEKLDFSF